MESNLNGPKNRNKEKNYKLFNNDGPFLGLRSKNVMIGERRTSMRLEPEMWQALRQIAKFEEMSINDICTLVEDSVDKRLLAVSGG